MFVPGEMDPADAIALHLPAEIAKIAQGYLSYSASKPPRMTASIFMQPSLYSTASPIS